MKYIKACYAHKCFSQFAIYEEQNKQLLQVRVKHQLGAVRELFSKFPEGIPVTLESIENWYWFVDEIETASCKPLMAHVAKVKVLMGNVNKQLNWMNKV